MSLLDPRVPAVLLRTDRNPFHHGTLGAVRSLGRAGVEVHVVAEAHHSPVARSRFVSGIHAPPAPDASPGEIAAVLRGVAARIARPAVLIPMDDATAVAVCGLREDLSGFSDPTSLSGPSGLPSLSGPSSPSGPSGLPGPSLGYLLPRQPTDLAGRVADKAELAAVCARVGVPHPVTLVPDSAAGLATDVRELGLPLVAKWSRPWLLPPGTGLRSTVVVRSGQEALALFRRSGEAGSRLLLQTLLPPGAGLDWFFHGYADRAGVLRGGGPGRKHRAWPPGAGLTTVGTWAPNLRVRELAERLVGALGYRGIFDLDFRRDATTGDYHLLDFNPRPGAQFRLFADASGTDVVRALHLDLTHRPIPDGVPLPGRAFVVENYAPLAALRPRRDRELAWHAADDRAPGLALWALWCRHTGRRLLAPRPSSEVRAVRQAPPPGARTDLTDDERASSI